MATPAVILAVKAAVTVVTDKRVRKVLEVIITAVLTPFILAVIVLVCLLSGTSDHNNAAVDLCFNGGTISSKVPEDYVQNIRSMQESFNEIDLVIKDLSTEMEEGSLDSIRVKAIFYSLYFGGKNPNMSSSDYRVFVDSFVRIEEQTRTVEHENGNTIQETYTVAIRRTLPEIYVTLENTLGRKITNEERANASEIYYQIKYGGSIPTDGSEFDEWFNGLPLSDKPFIGVDDFCSPLDPNWRSIVTSEFGCRIDPFTGKASGHTGLDLGASTGMPIRAVLDGTVLFVRYKTTGYGYHLAIDHGGGFVTLYGHCSKIRVTEGQAVKAGENIAEVGSTGRSTGPHLHFEIRINGEMKNPKSYLP